MKSVRRRKFKSCLAKYNGLRAQLNADLTATCQVLGFAILFLVFLLQQPVGLGFLIGLVLIAFGTVVCGRLVGVDAINTARRVRELEAEINARAGENCCCGRAREVVSIGPTGACWGSLRRSAATT